MSEEVNSAELERLKDENVYLHSVVEALQEQLKIRNGTDVVNGSDPDIHAVAARLDIHPESVRRILRRGRLAAYRVGAKWFVPQAALDAFAKTYDKRPGNLSMKGRVGL